jgi:acyl transferase domain-containing protein
LRQPSHAHAALVSLHYALHGVLSAWGLAPSVIVGAGAGEYAAAACAGALSWEEAIVQCVRRGVVLDGLAAGASQRLTVRQFKDELLSLGFDVPRVPLVSASLGRAFAPGEAPDGAHFAQLLYRGPDAGDACAAADWDACVTLGAVASGGNPTSLGARLTLPALSASGDDWSSMLDVLGALYVRGVEIDWRAFDAPYPRRKLSLPSYPFQRQRYWLDFPTRDLGNGEPVVIERASSHPLIKSVRIHSAPRSGFVRRTGNDDERGGEGSASSG